MSKQLIHAYVDSEVYLTLKAKKINLSQTVNKLLKGFLEFERLPDKSVLDIEEELKKINSDVENLQERRNLLTINLVKLQEEKSNKREENLKNADSVIKGMLNAGVLRE